ncbi:MAG: prepilin peptidase [Candidatus Saccharibacteria bacterium]|nr:prepilin peptidase [Candidatus Saccharibacteria bacterium]
MIPLTLVLLGLCYGSFVNALVWRIHKQATTKTMKGQAKYSIANGRSMCVHCEHVLSPLDLIPVLSWLSLRGKCRYCHKPIPDTPLSELATPLIFVISYVFWPLPFSTYQIFLFSLWLIFVTGFMALAIYDLRWKLLPNRVVFPLMWLSLLQLLLGLVIFGQGVHILPGIISASLVGGGIFWLLFQVSDGKWIGGGDVKLGFLVGSLFTSPLQSVLFIFLGSLIGTIVSLPLLLAGKAKRTSHLPFGPFLIASAILVRLFGLGIISWYKRHIGL